MSLNDKPNIINSGSDGEQTSAPAMQLKLAGQSNPSELYHATLTVVGLSERNDRPFSNTSSTQLVAGILTERTEDLKETKGLLEAARKELRTREEELHSERLKRVRVEAILNSILSRLKEQRLLVSVGGLIGGAGIS